MFFLLLIDKMNEKEGFELLIVLGTGIKAAGSYPKGHPTIEDRADQIIELIHAIWKETPKIKITFPEIDTLDNNIIINEFQIQADESPLFEKLINSTNHLGIKNLVIKRTCQRFEISELLYLFAHPPENFDQYNDINSLLTETKIQNVEFNSKDKKNISSESNLNSKPQTKTLLKKTSKLMGKETSILLFSHKLKETPEDKYGEEIIKEFFQNICGLQKGKANKVQKISDNYKKLGLEFIRQYGEKTFSNQFSKLKKTFQVIPNEIREEVFIQILSKGDHLSLTISKPILPLLSSDTISKGLVKVTSENKMANLDGFLNLLNEGKLSNVKKLLQKQLKKINWKTGDISRLLDRLAKKSSPHLISTLSTTDKKKPNSNELFENLKNCLDRGADPTQIKNLIITFLKRLESDSIKAKTFTLQLLQTLMNQLLDEKRINLFKMILNKFIKYCHDEKEMQVYSKYIETMVNVGLKAEELKYTILVMDVISFLAEEVKDTTKAKTIIPYLSEFSVKEAINILLSLLWEKDLREQVINEIEELSPDSLPYLMELLKETEDKEVRLALLNTIKSFGSPAIEAVKKYLKDDKWYVRRNAVCILGFIGDKKIIENIYRLRDDDERIQIEIIKGIKNILEKDAEPYIREFIESNSVRAVKFAIESLKSILTDKSLTALHKRLLKSHFSPSEEVQIKKTICDILADANNIRSLETLTTICKSTSIFGTSKYPEELKMSALKAIAKIKGIQLKDVKKSL